MSDCERITQVRSYQKSDLEGIAQVAHDKWATVSSFLSLLTKNEQMSDELNKFWLKSQKSYFLVCFTYVFLFKKKSDSLIPFFLMSNVSESLRWLISKEQPWGNCSGRSWQMIDRE